MRPTRYAIFALILASSLSAPGLSAASEPPNLDGWITERVSRARDAVEIPGVEAPFASEEVAAEWRLHRFSVNVRASAGLAIPGLGNVRVSPEIELMWERDE